MVYLAADNTLAVQGVLDIDEMEAAGADPDVQVLVQAEFSPTALSQAGCGEPSCFNRPNFQTLPLPGLARRSRCLWPERAGPRHGGSGHDRSGPVGRLHLLVQAELPGRALLLLRPLEPRRRVYGVADQTTAPGGLMSVGGLSTALTGAGTIDVLDFDMYLMAAYETLASIDGHAQFAVFSEEVVPGEGNPYTEILDALQANSTADGRAVAGLIADRFHASYQGNRASTTVSVYDLAGFAAFESALNAFASTLSHNSGPSPASWARRWPRASAMPFPELKDLVNFLEILRDGTQTKTVATASTPCEPRPPVASVCAAPHATARGRTRVT